MERFRTSFREKAEEIERHSASQLESMKRVITEKEAKIATLLQALQTEAEKAEKASSQELEQKTGELEICFQNICEIVMPVSDEIKQAQASNGENSDSEDDFE